MPLLHPYPLGSTRPPLDGVSDSVAMQTIRTLQNVRRILLLYFHQRAGSKNYIVVHVVTVFFLGFSV